MFMFGIHARAAVEGFESHPRCGICSCDGAKPRGRSRRRTASCPVRVERRALEPPVNRVGDRSINGPHAFPLNAGLDNNPTNRDF